MAFAHPAYKLVPNARDKVLQVRGKFLDRVRTPIARNEVDLAVVIKKNGKIMSAWQLVPLPRPLD
jgi:hypothetical protein